MGAKRRGGPGGLNKVCGVSPELQAIVGEPALPRTEVASCSMNIYIFCEFSGVMKSEFVF